MLIPLPKTVATNNVEIDDTGKHIINNNTITNCFFKTQHTNVEVTTIIQKNELIPINILQ